MPIDWWGTAPAWGSLIVAFLAVIFAGLSARANIRGNRNQQKQLEYQQKQLDRLESDKRQEQASKVAAWFDLQGTDIDKVLKGYFVTRGSLRIVNDSGIPIYHAAVWIDKSVSLDDQLAEGYRRPVIPPGVMEIEIKWTEPVKTERGYASIVFDDSQGITWYRDGLGGLKEVTEEEASLITRGVRFEFK